MEIAAEERRSRILALARARGLVRVPDLVDELDVSAMTIRRDLGVLAARGVIDRIHGGGVLRGASTYRPGRGLVERALLDGESPASERPHVGIVVPSGHYYFPAILAGAQPVFEVAGVAPTVVVTGYETGSDEQAVDALPRIGALLLAPNTALGDPLPAWISALPMPVVLLERTISSPLFSSVRTDHEAGAALAVAHLAGLGHRGVALVTQGSSQTKARVVGGWRSAVSAHGLDPARSPLVTTTPEANQNLWPANSAVSAVLDGLDAAGATAVLVHSDQTALALAHHARSRGRRVPEDLSIISYDNELADLADPPLTAVAPPKEWLGRAAAELLLRLATDAQEPVRHIVAEPTLVVRASTTRPCSAPASPMLPP